MQWLENNIITCINRSMHPAIIKNQLLVEKILITASNQFIVFFKIYELLCNNCQHISLRKTLLSPAVTQPLALGTLKVQEMQQIFCVVWKELVSRLPWKLDLLLGRKTTIHKGREQLIYEYPPKVCSSKQTMYQEKQSLDIIA